MGWWVPIIVSIIGGPVVVLLQMLRRENTTQHAESRGLLEHLIKKIDVIDTKFDKHIEEDHNV